jgi:hypothetical protein
MRSLCPTDIANKEFKSDHGSGGPQKAYFLAYIIHRYNPIVLWWERQKKILLLQMTRDHDREMLFFPSSKCCCNWEERGEGVGSKRSNIHKSQNCPFGTHISKKFNTWSTFWCMVTPFWSTFRLHLCEGPKAFKNTFPKNWTIKVWLWSGKDRPTWDNFTVHVETIP